MKNVIVFLTIAACLLGCASPTQVDKMAVEHVDAVKIAANNQTKNNISLNDIVGRFDTLLWETKVFGVELLKLSRGIPNVSNADYKLALEQSLKRAMLLSNAADEGNYLLDVKLFNLEQPSWGFDITVITTVEYTLKTKSTAQVIYNKIIVTPYTATFSDAALAEKRLRIACERAVQKNIEQIIDDLLSISTNKSAIKIE